MKNKIKLISLLIMICFSFGLGTNAVVKNKVAQNEIKKPVTVQKTVQKPSAVYDTVSALDVVKNPQKYLNKHITIKGTFDKFSTLGLDYKPAFRSSDKYITFLIKREDSINQMVPLSEMKIFIKRDDAEKHIDLNSGDIVEFNGFVFSNALGDVWIEVEKFSVISQKPKEDKTEKK